MEVTVLLLAQSVIAALMITVVVVCCVYGDEEVRDDDKDDDDWGESQLKSSSEDMVSIPYHLILIGRQHTYYDENLSHERNDFYSK